MHSRLPLFFFAPSVSPPPLLATCHEIKLQMLRLVDDDGSIDSLVSYEVHGTLDEGDGELLAALLSQFRTPRTEGGSHA